MANVGKTWHRSLALLRYSPGDFVRRLFRPVRFGPDMLPDGDFVRFMHDAASVQPVGYTDSHGPLLLIVSFMPVPYCLKMEGLYARAMRMRGYRVEILTNLACLELARQYHQELGGLKLNVLEDFLAFDRIASARRALDVVLREGSDQVERIKAFEYRQARVGLHALATLSAAMRDGRIALDRRNLSMLRRMMTRSMLLVDASHSMVKQLAPALLMGVEKGFVGTMEVFYAALAASVDYVQWTTCHEPDSIMLKRYRWPNFRDHPFTISGKAWERIAALRWDESYAAGVAHQFERGYTEGSWYRYKNLVTEQTASDREELMSRFTLDPKRKTAVIYSHILNDANLFYGDDLFSAGYEQWLVETVRAASENPHVNWILKLHPANVFRAAKSGYVGEYGELIALRQAFGEVPDFLRIALPEDKTSPLSFFRITDYGITVRGTVGIELPCLGTPVLTAGTGRYAGKGFTNDSASRGEYLERIRNIHLIPGLTEAQVRLAILHAHFALKARPARYDRMFRDVYDFPLTHPRHRDVGLGGVSMAAILEHPQMQKIVDFLCSDEEDFLDLEEDVVSHRDAA